MKSNNHKSSCWINHLYKNKIPGIYYCAIIHFAVLYFKIEYINLLNQASQPVVGGGTQGDVTEDKAVI